MDKMTKILLADDHSLIRNGLRQVLGAEPKFQIMEAENGEEALNLIRKQKPHVAILDIEMPKMTGFDVAKRAHNEGINVDVVFLTMFKDEALFNNAMDIGVKGYVLKENTVSEIMRCLKTVLEGKRYLSPEISDFLIRRNNKLATSPTDKKGIHLLTPAETNILKLLATMKTSQEMADELGVSVKTIQNHRNNICNKLEISGAHALLKFAVEHTSQL